MLPKSQFTFIFFMLIGLLMLLWSAQDWYELSMGTREGLSFCNIDSYWSCDQVSLSSYGAWFSVPIGLFGALWFWVAGLLGLTQGVGKKLLTLVFLPAWIVTAIYAGVLFFQMGAGCITCIIAYLALIGASLSFLLRRSHWSQIPVGNSMIVLGVGVFVLLVYAALNTSKLHGAVDEEEFQAFFRSVTPVEVNTDSPLRLGGGDGRIEVVDFSDYSCPACEQAARQLKPYLKSQEDVEVIFQPFPLSRSCHPPRGDHTPERCQWYYGSYCAQEQAKFGLYHDRMFRYLREEGGLPSRLEEALSEMPLDSEEFNDCLQSERVEEQLAQSIDLARQLEVSSTPTFFVEGRKLRGVVRLPVMKRLIEELRHQE